MNPELIIFDLAGTTVYDDRFVHKVLQEALSAHQVSITLDDANDVMGIPKPVAIEKLLTRRYTGRKPITDDWILGIHESFVTMMVSFYRNNPAVREMPGVTDMFIQLKDAGVKVGVDTGFDRAVTDALLDRIGWVRANLIDCSVTSDEVPRGRPYPDMIIKAMSLTGVMDAARVAKVGDTPSDLGEGTAAGCGWVIGVTSGAFSEQELARELHTHLVRHAVDIPSLLGVPVKT